MARVTKVHQPKLFEAVAAQLRERIVSGELRPGEELLEAKLAEEFGVSRGPVREALRELAREGLVVDLPRRRTLVSASTLADLIELYDVREALETFAVQVAIRTATPTRLARLSKLYGVAEKAWLSRTGPWSDRLDADLEFHREIFRVVGNVRMLGLYEQLTNQTAMLLRNAMALNPSLQLSPPEVVHKSIAEAVLARDPKAAVEAVRAHYQHTRDRLFMSGAATPPSPDAAAGPRPG